jgi:hypothetical protein
MKYEVGDAVYLANSATKIGQSRKLTPLWKDPYVVEEIVSPVLYKVGAVKKSWVVHHDRLRPCKDFPLPLWIQKKKQRLLGRGEEKQTVEERGEETPVYCFCRRPDVGTFMIACDACFEWFHGDCVHVTEREAKKIEYYICEACRGKGYRV